MSAKHDGVTIRHTSGLEVTVTASNYRHQFQQKKAAIKVLAVRLKAARFIGPPRLVRDYREDQMEFPEKLLP
jgi:protein subunit release factor A